MGELTKTRTSLLAIAVTAFISVSGVRMFFNGRIRDAETEIAQGRRFLAEQGQLFLRKRELETEWENKKGLFPAPAAGADRQNARLKGLLTYAQSQAIVPDKLELAGKKGGQAGDEMLVFISFRADIRKLAVFFYHLLEAEPLTRVESISIRQDDSRQVFLYELMLAEAVK